MSFTTGSQSRWCSVCLCTCHAIASYQPSATFCRNQYAWVVRCGDRDVPSVSEQAQKMFAELEGTLVYIVITVPLF